MLQFLTATKTQNCIASARKKLQRVSTAFLDKHQLRSRHLETDTYLADYVRNLKYQSQPITTDHLRDHTQCELDQN